jgi:hypothetical protein
MLRSHLVAASFVELEIEEMWRNLHLAWDVAGLRHAWTSTCIWHTDHPWV